MKINFPERGDVLYSKDEVGIGRFVSAPLHASFLLNPQAWIALGQDHTIEDDAGTYLTYRLTSYTIHQDDFARGEGYLVGVTHKPIDVISTKEHDEKISSAIDKAFEAGQAVAEQEAKEAALELVDYFDEPTDVYVRFADGSCMYHSAMTGISEAGESLMLVSAEGAFIGIHPSWRSYELIDIEDEAEIEGVPMTVNSSNEPDALDTCNCDGCKSQKGGEPAFAEAIQAGDLANKAV
ncbi:hypothetical protein [Pararhizobium qamdonense]|uniref:hypothetical protein n=1 Tax=Pararhizobium qamdonense TaxID=3031126 RepID=UPI0023E192B5|nr:hypothetical protein [Pararhizobium qamdonense]